MESASGRSDSRKLQPSLIAITINDLNVLKITTDYNRVTVGNSKYFETSYEFMVQVNSYEVTRKWLGSHICVKWEWCEHLHTKPRMKREKAGEFDFKAENTNTFWQTLGQHRSCGRLAAKQLHSLIKSVFCQVSVHSYTDKIHKNFPLNPAGLEPEIELCIRYNFILQ